jgi:hypothetical protein
VDTSFAARLTSIEVLKLSNTVNTVSLGSTATTAGISNVIGGTNDDSINAIAYTTSITLDGGGKAVNADTLTGGSTSADYFILANNLSSYYATTNGSTNRNYAVITNLTSNTLVGGNSASDRLVLNQSDFDSNLYTLGSAANGAARTPTHFGLYDSVYNSITKAYSSNLVADVSLSGASFTVAIVGSQDQSFLNQNYNHVTYI